MPDSKHVLFVCSQNRLRSPTAQHVFAEWPDVDTYSAGLGADAEVPLSAHQIDWADIIFVMEEKQRRGLALKFRRHLAGKPVVCLDIPDQYGYMQPELVSLLQSRAGPFLRQAT